MTPANAFISFMYIIRNKRFQKRRIYEFQNRNLRDYRSEIQIHDSCIHQVQGPEVRFPVARLLQSVMINPTEN